MKFWEIGNEIWGDWVRGHSDAATYANNLNRYVEKMKAVDPSIKIIASGDNNLEWNRTVLTIAGKNIDYLAVHHYYGECEMKGDVHNLWAHPLHYERFYRQMQQMIHELVPGRDIKLAINEWNTSLPTPPATLHGVCALCGASDECLRALRRSGSDERGFGHGERMVRRHHPSEPPCRVCHPDLSRK